VGHGRAETRACDVITDLGFLDVDKPWEDLHSIVRITAQRYVKKTAESQSYTRYYISSANLTAEKFNAAIRSHWAIENNLHWELDVFFGEDEAQRKNRNAVKNLNVMNKICLRMVEKHTKKLSKKGKMISAALNDEFREQVIRYF